MSGIFNSFIFNNQVFNTGTAGPTPPAVIADAKPGGGGIEAYKPTGFTGRKKLKLKKHDERIEEFQDAQIEIAAKLAREFTSEVEPKPVAIMSMAEVEAEIGMLLREKNARTEEDELMLMLLIAQADS